MFKSKTVNFGSFDTATSTVKNRDAVNALIDRVFDTAVRTNFPDIHKTFGIDSVGKLNFPKVNILSYEDRVVVETDVAGYTREDISIEVTDGTLKLSGRRSSAVDTQPDVVYVVRELRRGSFERSFLIDDALDCDKIAATFKNGVLTITIPKKPVAKKAAVKKVTITD